MSRELLNALIVCVLVLLPLTLIYSILDLKNPSTKKYENLKKKAFSFWGIVLLFLIFTQYNARFSIIGFCIISLLAHLEIIQNFKINPKNNYLVYISCFFVVLHYLFILLRQESAAKLLIPVGFTMTAFVCAIFRNEIIEFVDSFGKIFISLILCCYLMSYSVQVFNLNIPLTRQVSIFGFLIYLTEFNDVAQYFCGKAFGKKKIADIVSPNKTWAGFFGGCIATMLMAYLVKDLTHFDAKEVLFLSGMISIFGLVGDLSLSVLKRNTNVKDFADTIPGHGGIMDRLDSLVFAAPIFYFLVIKYV